MTNSPKRAGDVCRTFTISAFFCLNAADFLAGPFFGFQYNTQVSINKVFKTMEFIDFLLREIATYSG